MGASCCKRDTVRREHSGARRLKLDLVNTTRPKGVGTTGWSSHASMERRGVTRAFVPVQLGCASTDTRYDGTSAPRWMAIACEHGGAPRCDMRFRALRLGPASTAGRRHSRTLLAVISRKQPRACDQHYSGCQADSTLESDVALAWVVRCRRQ